MCGCLMCGYVHLCAGAFEGQKRAPDPQKLKLPDPGECWGLNLGPPQEQEALFRLLKFYILNNPTLSHLQYTLRGT